MKTSIYIILILALSTLLNSCEKDFLTRDAGVLMPIEKVFSDTLLASQFADNSYNFLIDDYCRFDLPNRFGATAEVCDEAVEPNSWVSTTTLIQGNWLEHGELVTSGLTETTGVYDRMYKGIRNATVAIEKIDGVNWKTQVKPQRIKGEQYFIRAFCYFELMKRFGGVVLMNKVYLADDDIDLPRNTYDECIESLLKDLDQADKLLPIDYDQANYGRATLGASKALRARVLLYAASELHNPGSADKQKWAKAAAAAKSVIDMNKYSLHPSYAAIMNVATSPEFIMIKIRGPRLISPSFIGNGVMSVGSGGGGSFSPAQNHVDLYEMSNGLPITDPASGYNPNNPYVNRDPRFYSNILYNDASWQGRKMQFWADTIGLAVGGGKKLALDYDPAQTGTEICGYCCRKLWPEVYKQGSSQTALVNYFFFRYGEILLNYAEAQNEAAGPDASVYVAINQIRSRAGMPDLPAGLSQSQMRSRIRNERAVELAFEDHRWYDLLRWKQGVNIINGPISGMDIKLLRDGTFKYRKKVLPPVFDRVFKDYMHLLPIPRLEIQKSKGILKQNPGW
jgi:hypothetical protein